MTIQDEEAAVRGHAPRTPAPLCDHDGTLVQIRTPPHGDTLLLSWCARCGALQANGETRRPTLLAEAVRDRDTMCETLTIVQDRCTELVKETRSLKRELDTNREVNRGALEAAIRIGDTQRTALERVAAELGVSVEWLITGDGPLLAKA